MEVTKKDGKTFITFECKPYDALKGARTPDLFSGAGALDDGVRVYFSLRQDGTPVALAYVLTMPRMYLDV